MNDTYYTGQIVLFAFDWAPQGWMACKGQLLQIAQHTALFSLLGTTYGGDGRTTFGLPDMKGKAPQGSQYCIFITPPMIR